MMRVTKKLYALLIAGMMAVSLAGCQSTGDSSNGGNVQSEQSSKGSTNSSTKSVSSDNIPDFSGNMTVAFPSTMELDEFIGKLQHFGKTSTMIVFSTIVENRGVVPE